MGTEGVDRGPQSIDWSILSGSYVSRRTILKLLALTGIQAACSQGAPPVAPTVQPEVVEGPSTSADCSAPPKAGGTARIINSGGGTNPIIDNEVLIWSIFDALVQQDVNANIRPGLAERWEVSSDGKTYTFFIRKDAKWTDGEVIDANDVVFTFDKVMDLDVASWGRRWFVGIIESWEAVDQFTVRFNLSRPAAPLINHFAEQRIAPEHVMGGLSAKELNEGDFRRSAPVCSGPFKFVELVPDTVNVTERNEGYYLARGANDYRYVPWLKRLEFHFWGDPNVNLLKMETGERDAHVLTMTRPEYDRLSQNPDVNVKVFPVGIYNYLKLNVEDPLFSDKRVRHAMAYAIDKETMVEELLGPIGQVQHSFVDPTSWAHNPNVRKYEYDPEQAKQLLAEAGWELGEDGVLVKDGERFEFECWTWKDNEVVEPIQAYLKEVGISMSIRRTEWLTVEEETMKPEFRCAEINDGYEAYADRRHRWHSENIPPKGVNIARYSNPELDEILDAAWATQDREAQKALYWQMQDILTEDLPWIPIFYPLMVQAVSKRLCGTEAGALYFVQTACKWWVSDATE